ncbi:hypothetical protein TSUD_289370 [Trifolium subterraneum]|uniref:Uncharacterized protein n=1 Tax=Trifolium subterraneum TaxID=3900 RepID=A0A2Z6MNK7_TRISU|nr:hypothetical protein TSUD_289370 [Trifolium subterraneum]
MSVFYRKISRNFVIAIEDAIAGLTCYGPTRPVPLRTNANPAVAATKANCFTLSHPIVVNNRSALPGSRAIDYPALN